MNADSSREFFRSAGTVDEIERRAADWIALRETRALTPTEAAAFAAWRAADPRHASALDELGAAWKTLDALRAYPRPPDAATKADADPEFFSPRPRRAAWRRILPFAAAAAAVIALSAGVWIFSSAHRANSVAVAAAPTTLRLDDGSEVELRAGSEIAPHFTAAERRVRLVRGEAHFTVAKNPARPFVVEAGGVAVRAVGTAFNVRLVPAAVDVIVTEGTVRVGTPETVRAPAAPATATLVAGQRTLVAETPAASPAVAPVVETLAPAAIDRALAWQASRLVFDATPLAEVVAQFQRHTGRRLVLADPALGELPVSGRFRASNVDSFLELLEGSFDLRVEHRTSEIVLRRAEK